MKHLIGRLQLYVNYNCNYTYYSLASRFGDFVHYWGIYPYIARGGYNYDFVEVDQGREGFIKAFATYIMLEDSLTEDLSAQIALKLTVGNTAISKLEYNDEKKKWRIENWNDEVHLG